MRTALFITLVLCQTVTAQEQAQPGRMLDLLTPGMLVRSVTTGSLDRVMLAVERSRSLPLSKSVWRVKSVGTDYVTFETRDEFIHLPQQSIIYISSPKSTKPATDTSNGKLTQQLKRELDIDFRRTPLQEAVDYISKASRIPISIDGDALKMNGYTKNMPQTYRMMRVSVAVALRKIETDYNQLLFVRSQDGKGLLLSSKDRAREAKLTPALPPVSSRPAGRSPIRLPNGSRQSSRPAAGRLTADALESVVKNRRNRLVAATRSVGAFNSGLRGIRRDALMIAATAEMAANFEPPVVWQKRATDFRISGEQLYEGATSTGTAAMRKTRLNVEQLSSLLMGGSLTGADREQHKEVASDKMFAELMKSQESTYQSLKDNLPGVDKMTQDQRLSLANEASVPAIVAWNISREKFGYSDDEDFVKQTKELTAASVALRKAILEGKPEDARSSLADMARKCTECHASFRN